MASMGPIQSRGQITDVKQVMNYVYQLEEQMRYALKHLDSGNIQEGSIGAEQLSSAVLEKVNKAGRQVSASTAKSASRTKTDSAMLDGEGYKQQKGTFQVRGDGESFLSLGGSADSPNIRITADGEMAAKKVNVTGGRAPALHIGLDATAEEKAQRLYQIVIAENKPAGHGIIWLKPAAETVNGLPCTVYYIE